MQQLTLFWEKINCNDLKLRMWIPPHSHTLTLRLKILHPSFYPVHRQHRVWPRLPRAAGGPGSISPSSQSRPRAERAPAEPCFLFQTSRSRDASPGLSEEAARSPAGAGRPLFPKVAEARLPTQVSAQLANSAAAVAVAGFSMWCVPSLTHSSSHSQTFSIRAHSSLPGFFKRLEISSGGLRCHPNGNRSSLILQFSQFFSRPGSKGFCFVRLGSSSFS